MPIYIMLGYEYKLILSEAGKEEEGNKQNLALCLEIKGYGLTEHL